MKKSKGVVYLSAAYYVAGPTLGAETETAAEEKLQSPFASGEMGKAGEEYKQAQRQGKGLLPEGRVMEGSQEEVIFIRLWDGGKSEAYVPARSSLSKDTED